MQGLGITHVVNAAEGDWVASVNVDKGAFKENGEENKGESLQTYFEHNILLRH